MARIAILSMHTSPLAQPGTGDGGGMNVYVRELASALARSGNRCEVFTRRESPQSPKSINVEPGFVVHYVDAGPLSAVPKERLEELVPEFTEHVLSAMRHARWSDEPAYDVIHANYWLSGLAGHTLKHELDIPLISTFHTLDRVKAEAMPEEVVADISQRRAEAEALVIGCSDAVLASCDVEANQLVDLYGADRSRIAVIPPGVDHAFFGPGESAQARRALGLASSGSLLLFVGRIQPLKGAHIAVAALACLRDQGEDVSLVIVGGPSGDQGDATLRGLNEQVSSLGMEVVLLSCGRRDNRSLSIRKFWLSGA
jgi:D-inositol-3-phosphate glycosyltransferase